MRADICNSTFGIGRTEIIPRALMRRSYVYAPLVVKNWRAIDEKKEGDSNFSADCRYIGMPSVAGDTRYTRRLRAFTRIKQQVTQFLQGTIAHVDQSETRNRRPVARSRERQPRNEVIFRLILRGFRFADNHLSRDATHTRRNDSAIT